MMARWWLVEQQQIFNMDTHPLSYQGTLRNTYGVKNSDTTVSLDPAVHIHYHVTLLCQTHPVHNSFPLLQSCHFLSALQKVDDSSLQSILANASLFTTLTSADTLMSLSVNDIFYWCYIKAAATNNGYTTINTRTCHDRESCQQSNQLKLDSD